MQVDWALTFVVCSGRVWVCLVVEGRVAMW